MLNELFAKVKVHRAPVERTKEYRKIENNMKSSAIPGSVRALLVAFLLSSFLFSQAVSTTSIQSEANAAFDRLLELTMTNHGKKLEPYFVAAQKMSFNRRIALITFRGQASLKNIELDGISAIKRSGDVQIDKSTTGTVLKATFKLPAMFFHADAEVSLMGVGPKRHFYGQLDDTAISAEVYLNKQIESVNIHSLNIVSLKNIRLKVDGRWPLTDVVSNLILKGTTTVFQRSLRYLVQNVMRLQLEATITESEAFKDLLHSI